MRHYMEISARIYGIYLEYVSPLDVHVYSIDECFIDATSYLSLYGLTAREFADELRGAVLARTGITATAGIGPNLFLAKVALDITAKHEDDGIGELDEERFRQDIWRHRPITDIWGIGPGTAERLAKYRVYDLMGVAALDERILYREFGVNAEYLIDHAHGIEPCTIAEIQAYRPQATSMVNGQVLSRNYSYDEALTVLRARRTGRGSQFDLTVCGLWQRGPRASKTRRKRQRVVRGRLRPSAQHHRGGHPSHHTAARREPRRTHAERRSRTRPLRRGRAARGGIHRGTWNETGRRERRIRARG